MRLGLDTVYLVRSDQTYLRLDNRCVDCSALLALNRFAVTQDLVVIAEQEHCGHAACLEPTYQGTRFCKSRVALHY